MKTRLLVFNFIMATAIIALSCSSDDNPVPVNEEEVITTMTLTLVPQGGGDNVVLQTRDLDGDGPNPPVVTVSGDFSSNTSYDGSIVLLNETESPAEDITEEVEEEADEHQFFFQLGGTIDVTAAYADTDDNGNPIGLSFTLSAGDASNGTLTVILRHQPDKDATGVSDGDITNAGGETDIEQTFQVSIQ